MLIRVRSTQSHFYDVAEVALYMLYFYLYTTLGNFDSWTVRIYIFALFFSPLFFNPQVYLLSKQCGATCIACRAWSLLVPHRYGAYGCLRSEVARGRATCAAQMFSFNMMKHSIAEVLLWLAGDLPVSKDHHGSWQKWHTSRMNASRTSTLTYKLTRHDA